MSEELTKDVVTQDRSIHRMQRELAEHRHYRDQERDEWVRMVNRYGRAEYDDHFRSGVIPAGYVWVNDGTFNGAPGAVLDYSVHGTYMQIVCDNTPHFLAKAITVYDDKRIVGRFTSARNTIAGVRVDDGTNNNFAEMYLDAGTTGTYQFVFRFRAGGGGITTNGGANKVDDELSVILLRYYTPTPQIIGYLCNECGEHSNQDGHTTGAIAWTPSRVGLVYMFNNGYPCYTDWFYNTFT